MKVHGNRYIKYILFKELNPAKNRNKIHHKNSQKSQNKNVETACFSLKMHRPRNFDNNDIVAYFAALRNQQFRTGTRNQCGICGQDLQCTLNQMTTYDHARFHCHKCIQKLCKARNGAKITNYKVDVSTIQVLDIPRKVRTVVEAIANRQPLPSRAQKPDENKENGANEDEGDVVPHPSAKKCRCIQEDSEPDQIEEEDEQGDSGNQSFFSLTKSFAETSGNFSKAKFVKYFKRWSTVVEFNISKTRIFSKLTPPGLHNRSFDKFVAICNLKSVNLAGQLSETNLYLKEKEKKIN
uniref:Transposase n=1 Tax=Romanomermis culicivorax TaxID=13658 RepID=A0A915KIF8_ROMCU